MVWYFGLSKWEHTKSPITIIGSIRTILNASEYSTSASFPIWTVSLAVSGIMMGSLSQDYGGRGACDFKDPGKVMSQF